MSRTGKCSSQGDALSGGADTGAVTEHTVRDTEKQSERDQQSEREVWESFLEEVPFELMSEGWRDLSWFWWGWGAGQPGRGTGLRKPLGRVAMERWTWTRAV